MKNCMPSCSEIMTPLINVDFFHLIIIIGLEQQHLSETAVVQKSRDCCDHIYDIVMGFQC